MRMTRRMFVGQAAAAMAAANGFAAEAAAKVKVGACVLSLDEARRGGVEGIQIGEFKAADTLGITTPERRAHFKRVMQETGVPVCSIMMGLFNEFPLATEPRAVQWMEQCIDTAKDLGTDNILLAFFSNGDLQHEGKLKEAEYAEAVKRIKAVAPRAKDAGVSLAIENYLSAEQNLRMLDAINHEAVSIYYDVYNTGISMKYDSPAEIRRLKGRISQVHYKNADKYLDADRPYFESVTAALKDIGYKGWIVLETSAPSKDPFADAKRNADFVRALFA
ncbi:MAG: sugar phosphate isomerase/epimerase [Kiritimatiellaeota bacterium]|nr:sugar phosphate isomerase/epimerase [Kiritimatiellota bacterium]